MQHKSHEVERINFDTGELEQVNNNFVQLYIDKLDLIIQMTSENATAVKVFTWLLKHMDKKNALVVSQQALSEALCLSRQTIYNAVKYLKEKKAVAVLRSGNTNVYAVNAQIAWKSDARGKRYALFDTKIYVSELEQEEEKPIFSTELIGVAVKKKKKRSSFSKSKGHEAKEEIQSDSESE
jgi:hypothetical protein